MLATWSPDFKERRPRQAAALSTGCADASGVGDSIGDDGSHLPKSVADTISTGRRPPFEPTCTMPGDSMTVSPSSSLDDLTGPRPSRLEPSARTILASPLTTS